MILPTGLGPPSESIARQPKLESFTTRSPGVNPTPLHPPQHLLKITAAITSQTSSSGTLPSANDHHRRLALQPRPCHGLRYRESSSPLLPMFSATAGRPSPVRRAWPSHDSESNSPPRSNYQPNVIPRHAALRQRPHRRLALQPRPCHGLSYLESSSPLLPKFSATTGRPSPVRRAWQSPQSLGHHRVTDTTS